MLLTRDFKETIMVDLRRDRAYHAAYLAKPSKACTAANFLLAKGCCAATSTARSVLTNLARPWLAGEKPNADAERQHSSPDRPIAKSGLNAARYGGRLHENNVGR